MRISLLMTKYAATDLQGPIFTLAARLYGECALVPCQKRDSLLRYSDRLIARPARAKARAIDEALIAKARTRPTH